MEKNATAQKTCNIREDAGNAYIAIHFNLLFNNIAHITVNRSAHSGKLPIKKQNW
ncbi:MAG: hypothetical protein LBC53_10420 [Spirochaetaceae bacterium]|jgi:hypothetical protein|nr:hypothetical protein [Spirochaetaceae bacterium]